MTAIYTAQHLTKKYGGHTALRDVSFSIEPGRLSVCSVRTAQANRRSSNARWGF